jgi:hypothetical protein
MNELIEFAVYLTGHDEDTINHMYTDWKPKNSVEAKNMENESKGLNVYPFWVQVICLPITYALAILKILVVIPAITISWVNDTLENIG